mmetsp:Transcript_1666/g.2280  ORF Transcript_1666/g.2280 Transcript_1666/m.2280 type:complete len:81 (-) Transcript_1666:314-556(-)
MLLYPWVGRRHLSIDWFVTNNDDAWSIPQVALLLQLKHLPHPRTRRIMRHNVGANAVPVEDNSVGNDSASGRERNCLRLK